MPNLIKEFFSFSAIIALAAIVLIGCADKTEVGAPGSGDYGGHGQTGQAFDAPEGF